MKKILLITFIILSLVFISAIPAFADYNDDYYDGYNDEYYDDYEEESTFDIGENIIIALAIGLVITLIIMTVMKSKLKTVKAKANASDYVRPGSMVLTRDLDIYLYRNVTRTKKQNNSNRR